MTQDDKRLLACRFFYLLMKERKKKSHIPSYQTNYVENEREKIFTKDEGHFSLRGSFGVSPTFVDSSLRRKRKKASNDSNGAGEA